MGCSMQPIAPEPNFILQSELHHLIETPSEALNNCLIIDVRDALMDYDGGYVKTSVHISHKIFQDKISEMFSKFHTKSKVILCDMYGSISGRSILCSQLYHNCRKEIVSNYSRKSAKSYYYVNVFEDDQKQKNENNKANKRRVDVICDSEMISNLQKQDVCVLQGGVFELVNGPFASIIHNFDESKWEQLEIAALYDHKMWYHKKEYFGTAKFQELKQQTKSTNFQGVSSNAIDNQTAFLQEYDAFEQTFIEK